MEKDKPVVVAKQIAAVAIEKARTKAAEKRRKLDKEWRLAKARKKWLDEAAAKAATAAANAV